MNTLFRKITEDAKNPTRGTELSAGHDFYATESGTIEAGKRMMISTGIGWNFEIMQDMGLVGILKERSSHAYKFGINLLAGIIDADYPDEIKVILLNTGDKPFVFEAGDKIAQMVITQFAYATDDEVVDQERTGGFGSTGK